MNRLVQGLADIADFVKKYPGSEVVATDYSEQCSLGWSAHALVNGAEQTTSVRVSLVEAKTFVEGNQWLRSLLSGHLYRKALASLLQLGFTPHTWTCDEEGAYAVARLLAPLGFQAFPCDDAERGLQGLMLFCPAMSDTSNEPQVSWPRPDVELSFEVSWPIFDKELKPQEAYVTASELAFFVENFKPILLADDPKALKLGFVKYEPQKGLALIRKISLSELKGAPELVKDAIVKAREPLLTHNLKRLSVHQAKLAT